MAVITALKCDECDEMLEIPEKAAAEQFAKEWDWEYDPISDEAKCDECKE